MKLNVSPQHRFVLVVALVALVAIGFAVVTLGRAKRAGDESSQPPPPARVDRVSKPTPAPVRPRPTGPVADALEAGLPAVVARALGQSRTVVVHFHSPEAELDRVAFEEAAAGASAAGAGFVSIDVTSEADAPARLLATKLQVLSAPTLLVFTRPGTLTLRIDGFADQQTVAQAAANAAS